MLGIKSDIIEEIHKELDIEWSKVEEKQTQIQASIERIRENALKYNAWLTAQEN